MKRKSVKVTTKPNKVTLKGCTKGREAIRSRKSVLALRKVNCAKCPPTEQDDIFRGSSKELRLASNRKGIQVNE
jgi:hypothetical protein